MAPVVAPVAEVGHRGTTVTPTLAGRWQTRVLLLLTIGMMATLPFVLAFGVVPLVSLALVLGLGIGWDVAYNWVQRGRCDRDWPPAYQALTGVLEGCVTYGVLFGISDWDVMPAPVVTVFVAHYVLIWTLTFVASQSVLRIAFPHWRYDGGRWLR